MPGTEIAVHLAHEIFIEAGKGIFGRLMSRRAEEARQVLLAAIAKGRVWRLLEDDTAAAMYAFLRAAMEGAARTNHQP